MGNWSLPSLTDLYTNFLTYLKARDDDATRMHDSRVTAATNVPDYAKRWNATTQTFQNWLSAAWSSIVLAVAGGGTGATTAAGARTNLDLYSTSEVDALVDAAMTMAENDKTTQVALTNAGTFYDGPSVSLSAGTWFIVGYVLLYSESASAGVAFKLWDGTTVYANTYLYSGVLYAQHQVTLCAIVTIGSTTTLKISAAASVASACYIKPSPSSYTTENKASSIRAVKIG